VRLALVLTSLGAFAALGVVDLLGGEPRTGIAAVLLAVANGLLLLR